MNITKRILIGHYWHPMMSIEPGSDIEVVAYLRTILAREYNRPIDYHFFEYDLEIGVDESISAMLVRLYRAEREHHVSAWGTVQAMING